MKKNAIIIMVLLLIVSIAIVGIFFHKDITMNVRLNSIVHQYGNITSRCEIVSKENVIEYINLSNTNKNKFINSSADKSFVKINLNGKKGQHDKPNEIISTMAAYLFIKENGGVDEISGFICCYQSGKTPDLNSVDVVFSISELNELFDEIELYSENVDAQEMAVKWMGKNYYFRNGLEMNVQYSDLISEWNRYVTSDDGNFQLGYIYADNRLKVLNLEYNKHENVDIVTSKTMWNIKVDESGKVYAVWDEENNIWMLGETSGIKMFLFDGKDSWVLVDDYSDFQIPNIFNDITFK